MQIVCQSLNCIIQIQIRATSAKQKLSNSPFLSVLKPLSSHSGEVGTSHGIAIKERLQCKTATARQENVYVVIQLYSTHLGLSLDTAVMSLLLAAPRCGNSLIFLKWGVGAEAQL